MLWRALGYVTSLSLRKTNNVWFHPVMVVKKHVKKQGKMDKQYYSNQTLKLLSFFVGMLVGIRVYKTGQNGTFFAGIVAESDGMWVLNAHEIDLLSIKCQIPISWNFIISVMWEETRWWASKRRCHFNLYSKLKLFPTKEFWLPMKTAWDQNYICLDLCQRRSHQWAGKVEWERWTVTEINKSSRDPPKATNWKVIPQYKSVLSLGTSTNLDSGWKHSKSAKDIEGKLCESWQLRTRA